MTKTRFEIEAEVNSITDRVAVVSFVAWPLNESETRVDLVLIETSLLSYAHDAVSRNLHKKSSEVSIKTRSTPASLSFKGQATKHTTVKWSIGGKVVM